MSSKPISMPAGFAPAFAIGFADPTGGLSIVNDGAPLPVCLADGGPLAVHTVTTAPPAALNGETGEAAMAGPFAPVPGRTVMLTLAGTWTGRVQLLRSIDGGQTRHPVTVGGMPWGEYTANACEPVWNEDETGATLWLAITPTSGNVSYRLAQ